MLDSQSPILVVHDTLGEDNDRFVRHSVTLVNGRYLTAVIEPPSGIMKKRDLFTEMKDLTVVRIVVQLINVHILEKK